MKRLRIRRVPNVRTGRARAASARRLLPVLAVALSLGLVGASPASAHAAPSPAAVPPGTGLAWGDNYYGQLGNGTNTDSNVPVPVDLPAGTRITAITASGLHSLGLTSTGTVLAWGDNYYGQLGNGTNTDSNVPVPVDLPAGTRITAITAGQYHSLALTSTGTVLAWGGNDSGQLGNGTTTNSRTPVPVALPGGTRITAIAAGSSRHSLALTSTGTMLAWGNNYAGQLGNGTTTNSRTPVPVALPGGTRITAIAAGSGHSLALTSTGTMLAWGYNHYGQLGNGTNTDSRIPVPVSLPNPIVDIAAGVHHSLALTSTGVVLAWGDNYYGQLGNGTAGIGTDINVPIAVDFLPTITAIDAGGEHNLVLTSTGTMYAWGYNVAGQLGNGTNTSSSRPVPVNLPTGTRITAIAAGGDHTLAITAPPTSTTTLRVSPPDPGTDPEVTLTATVTCTTGTPTGTVTFLDGTTRETAPLSGSPTATATLTLHLQPGRHIWAGRS
ncbi:RCC1 domain-containing protein [Micromonospora echinospora]